MKAPPFRAKKLQYLLVQYHYSCRRSQYVVVMVGQGMMIGRDMAENGGKELIEYVPRNALPPPRGGDSRRVLYFVSWGLHNKYL